MSGPFGSQQWMYSSGFYPHEIDNSARLDTNSYYTRTPSSAGNRKTWTWSGWVKRTTLGTDYVLTAKNGQSSEPSTTIGFRNDAIRVIDANGSDIYYFDTPAVYRDCSAWYHIVVVADTTNSTANDRFRLYVNGERATVTWGDTPPQNHDTALNSSILHYLFAEPYQGGFNTHDGYLAEVNFVDGTALTPTSFGETKADTWIPKKYTGSYGTNGYYLDFATRATDPIDASGNGNNWGSVNVASTDWMLDSPTNNFATINPLIERWAVKTNTYTEGNLKVTSTGTSAVQFATMQADKIYFEMLCTANSAYPHICVQEEDLQNEYGSYGMFYSALGQSRIGGVDQTIATYGVGDIVALAYDHYGGEGRIYKNGTLLRTTTGQNFDSYMETYLAGGILASGDGAIWNFGQDSSFAGNKTAQGNTDSNGHGDFYYQPPDGFLAICSANQSDPVTTVNPSANNTPQDHFNTVLYTGTGASGHAITGVGFQPDLVWIKSRSNAASHGLHDALRVISGAEEILYSDSTAAGNTGGAYLSSFDSDGFTVNNNSSGNGSGITYVAWNWKAGGSGVSNTDGDITSTVSANTDAGFSVVTFTAVNGSSNVGHGLDKEPEIIIHKGRSFSNGWYTFTKLIDGSVDYARLDTTTAFASSGTMAFDSTTFKDWYSSGDFVAYCFHSVEGFSKFGKYTGNGSTDGPFINTGFRPAFVIIKNASSVGGWRIWDNKRNPFNLTDNTLHANDATAENTYGNDAIDMTSNGLKIRTVGSYHNTSGDTYIYMAFAEMPFKYANAR